MTAGRCKWTIATSVWLLLTGVIILATASDYGDSWDERVRSESGELKLDYYENLLAGNFQEALRITPANDNYPGFHDLTVAVLKRISPVSDYLTGNLFAALLGFLGIVGAIRLGRLIGGAETGFWAGVLLTLLPAYYGHMFINPKDIPFAMGYIWGIGFLYQWIKVGNRLSGQLVILSGVFMGITMASRIGGLLLICYLGLFIALGGLVEFIGTNRGDRMRFLKTFIAAQLPRLAIATAISNAILLFFWPAGQSKPFSGVSKTLGNVTQYDWSLPVFFDGQFIPAPELPATYIVQMILLKVPVIILVLFAVAVGYYLSKLSSLMKGMDPDYRAVLGEGLIYFSIFFPIVYVIIRDSVLYNGLRHLLFVLPPMCVLAANAIPRLWDSLGNGHRFIRPSAIVALSIGLALPLIHMVRLHPYQYTYYNELAGGTAKAAQKYELDYWGTVYKEMAEAFYAYLKTEKPSFTKPEVIVNMEHVTYLFSPFLPEETSLPIHVVRSQPMIDDYYAASTIWSADQFYYGETIVEVQRAGVTLGVVKDRRHLKPEERELGYEK